MAILDVARIEPGDVVLVTAAAGGLGALLTQAARQAGARVIGAAGPGKPVTADVRRSTTRCPAGPTSSRRSPWCSTASAAPPAARRFERLARGGRHVLYGWSAGEMTPITTGDIVARSLTVSSALVRPGDLRALEERALASGLTPLVTTFPLADAAAAHAALEARRTVGKVVLVP